MPNPYDAAWRKVRALHLKRHPLCVRCGAKGRDVDHLVSIRQAPRRRLDPTNLQTLCHSCHSRITALHDHPQANPQRGAAITGAPLDPGHPWHQASVQAGEIKTTDITRWHKGRPIKQERERE